MADRLNHYPGLSHHFNSNMLQQQQQQQQLPQHPQQQSQSDPHPLQGIPNPERTRMWQAAVQHYHGQNGSEIAGSQPNTQMPDLLRNQNLARVQNQMGQQQFGLPSSQINPPGQHSSFHDQQGGQQSQAQMPANFGNPNSAQLQANINTRNSMLPNLASASAFSRQIELMGMAQNQQHQNPQIGPPSFATRMTQQQQHQAGMNGQSGQSQGQSLFGSQPADVNRGSPPHPTQPSVSMPLQQGGIQPNVQGLPAGRRPMTLMELRERATFLRTYIANQEAAAATLTTKQASMEPSTYVAQMRHIVTEARLKKDLLAKVLQAMSAIMPQGQNNGTPSGSQGGNPGNMPTMGSSPIPQHQQAGPNGANQSPWLSQAGSAQSQGFQIRGVPQLPSRGPSQPQNPQAVHQANPPNQIQQNNLGPQRPVSTSRQVPTQMSPPSSNQFTGNQFSTSNGQSLAQFPLPPPLEKAQFQESYAAFCSNHSIVYDERLMSVDNRPVDLHALHHHVLSEGGATKVTQRDLWPVIGARMGFVQFPGTDTEPDKSGPGVAQQLQHLHKEYLSHFDQTYVHSVLQKKGFFPSLPNPVGPSQVNNPQSNNPTAGTSGGNMGQVNMMNAVIAYANTSAADMRARSVPEPLIQFVEQNRLHLQRTMQQQQAFRGMMQKPNAPGSSGQTSEPERILSGFTNISPQQQQAIPSAGARPPPPQGHPQSGMNISGASHGQPQPHNPAIHGVPSWPARPTPEQSQQSIQVIARVKQDFVAKNLPTMKPHQVPDNQRMDYMKTLEQAYRYAQDIEPKLPMYFYVLRDTDMIRKLVAIICTTREQRNLIVTNPNSPKFILPFNTLSTLIAQVQNANAQFNIAVSAYGSHQAPSVPQNNGHPPSNGGSQQRPPVPQQGAQHVQSAPSLPTQSAPPSGSRSVNLHLPPPPKKKPQQAQLNAVNAAATAPSPTPPASTPAAATPAATPAAAASPKTPKSPKGKAPAKPKVSASAKRKSSKVVPPTPEPAQPTAPSPAGSLKRQREEEETTVDTPAASNAPSPKKMKTESEWEGPLSDELVKKEEQVENIKTEEDASAFLEQMTELIRLAAGNDQESLTSDISQTLDMILKGCGQDHADVSGASSSMAPLGFGDPSPPPIHVDEFQDFLDFTSCAVDDIDSKPTTPDLVSSSSTNPSPESASDPADAGHSSTGVSSDTAKSTNFKLEETEDGDPFRLGVWKEIDGGQSVYYQSNKWDWEAPMHAQDQSWAFAS